MSPPIPLARWADGMLARLASISGSDRIAELTGAGLLGERAMLGGFAIPDRVSAGAGCRMYLDRDGAAVALNLARAEDREMLPALFAGGPAGAWDDPDIAAQVARADGPALTARGREMGLAIACERERGTRSNIPVDPVLEVTPRDRPKRQPLVIDLSALWAGPLAGHLLWLAGARVIKVENPNRPDAMRDGDPRFFALLNQGKLSVTLDPRETEGRAKLLALLRAADVVIESARPRALWQLGIHALELVRENPGLIWINVAGHGVRPPTDDWVGFGDDCGVSGGLALAMRQACGQPGFVGDAIADPLTGMVAAHTAIDALRSGKGGRYGLSMSGIVAQALAEEQSADDARLHRELRAWHAATGQPFPPVAIRQTGPVAPLGHDNDGLQSC